MAAINGTRMIYSLGITVSTIARKIIIIFIYCNWVVTQRQWLFYMYTKHEIGYY